MITRTIHRHCLALLFCFLGRLLCADDRPNIVFMLSDDQGWNGLSVAMHPDFDASRGEIFRTPNLEAFARQGMRFSAAYAPAPVCSPTRISLQTGKNPARLHWTKAAPPVEGQRLLEPKLIKQLSSPEITIGELLQGAGYATAHYGKWHIEGGGPGAHGYEEHDGNTGNENAFRFVDPNPVDIFGMAERATKFMEKNRDEGRPFYIQLSWNALHAPELARRSTQAKYNHLLRENNSKQASVAAITEDLDEGVGRILTAIHELGLSQNTYVIYMSDNGSGGGKRGGLSGGKGSLWEGGIRVPFLIRGPGILPNTWCHTPIVGYDLLPTFCQWAGVASDQLPLSIDGGSIDSLLHGGGDGIVHRPRPELVFHFPHYQGNVGPHSALRVDDWKLIFFYEDERMSLFDLSKDLGERQDLAESMPEKTHRLKLQLNEQLVAMDAQFPTANPNFDPQEIPPPRQSKGPRNVPKPKGGKNRENKSEKPKENP